MKPVSAPSHNRTSNVFWRIIKWFFHLGWRYPTRGFVGIGRGEELEIFAQIIPLKTAKCDYFTTSLGKIPSRNLNYFNNMDKETAFMRHIAKLRYPNTETAYTKFIANSPMPILVSLPSSIIRLSTVKRILLILLSATSKKLKLSIWHAVI